MSPVEIDPGRVLPPVPAVTLMPETVSDNVCNDTVTATLPTVMAWLSLVELFCPVLLVLPVLLLDALVLALLCDESLFRLELSAFRVVELFCPELFELPVELFEADVFPLRWEESLP